MKYLQTLNFINKNTFSYFAISVAFFVCLNIFCSHSTNAQSLQSKIQITKVDGQKVKGSKLGNVLANIAKEYNIPISFETKVYLAEIVESDEEASKTEITKNAEKEIIPITANVPEVLDYLIELNPDYRWSIENEIIAFYPIQNRSAEVAGILDTQIKKAQISFKNGPTSLGYELVKTNELKLRLEYFGLESFLVPGINNRSTNIKLIIKDKTVRQILNERLANGDFKFWMVSVSVSSSPEAKFLNIITI